MNASVELSIIICTRNRAVTLPACLNALSKLRSDRTWEVLMVDNASTDATADVLAKADKLGGRMRVMRVDRIGLGHARDAAWREARGNVVSFTDDDCYVAVDYVDAVLAVFDEAPDIACVGGRIMLYDSDDVGLGVDTREFRMELAPRRYVSPGCFQGANLSIKRSVLEKIGGVDTDLGAGTPFPCEDIDMVAAIVWQGFRALYDPSPTVWHHHGRKLTDVDKVLAGYDRGGGAYFAKYIMRCDSRKVYMTKIISMRNNSEVFSSLVENTVKNKLIFYWRQCSSAVRYSLLKRKFFSIIFWIIFFNYAIFTVFLAKIYRTLVPEQKITY